MAISYTDGGDFYNFSVSVCLVYLCTGKVVQCASTYAMYRNARMLLSSLSLDGVTQGEGEVNT